METRFFKKNHTKTAVTFIPTFLKAGHKKRHEFENLSFSCDFMNLAQT